MSKDKTYRRLITSKRWASLARDTKTQAQWTCSECGRTTSRLAVHHITPVETARNESEMERLCFSKANLQVLCFDCHADIHKSMRRSSRDVAQERCEQHVDRLLDSLLGDG